MAGREVTDPELLKLLNGNAPPAPAGPKQVTDPALLAQLNAPEPDGAPGGEEAVADPMGNAIPGPARPPVMQAGMMPYGEQMANVGSALGRGADNAVRLLASGATLGTVDKLEAATEAGAKKLFGLDTTYEKELAGQRDATKQAEEAAGPVATGALKTAGNLGAMAAASPYLPVFGQNAVTRGLGLGTGLGTRAAVAGATMGSLGVGAGYVNEDDPTKKVASAISEGGVQAGLGAGGPVAGAALGAGAGIAGRLIANRYNPLSYASDRVSRALTQSGRSIDDVTAALTEANAEGSPMIAADVMGYSGRRALSNVARQPGAGREATVEALESRQAGQTRRLQNAITEGFDAPATAEATERGLTTARDTAANQAYGAARAEAAPVDVSRAVQAIDDVIGPPAAPRTPTLARDTIESSLHRVRERLANGDLARTEFEAVNRVRQDVQDEIARVGAQTNRGRLLGNVERELGQAMSRASAPQAAADAAYAQSSRTIEAVGAGRQAAMRGRTEDTLPRFATLGPEEQAAFRSGYADPYVETLQKTPHGTNAARPLTSEAVRTEFPAVAGPERGPLLMRRIDREGEMFRTRTEALGNSKTAENLADMAAERGMDSGVLADAIMANAPGLYRRAVQAVANALTGSTEAGRNATAELLLSRDPGLLRRVFQSVADSNASREVVARALGVGAVNAGGAAYRANRQ